jgi:hypothetical protein
MPSNLRILFLHDVGRHEVNFAFALNLDLVGKLPMDSGDVNYSLGIVSLEEVGD